jgi:parvulin-like peptidyl-prolyl isomerase
MLRFVVLKSLTAAALLATADGSAFSSEPQVLDGVAAIVKANGADKEEVITFSQVRELVGPREKALHNQFTGKDLVEKIKELRLSAVKDLIDRQLVIQEFKKSKFQIPDYVIEDHMQTIIREEFGGDRNAFVRTLEAQGYTLQKFKEAETDKIIVQAMRQKNVKSDLIVSPQKIEDYYEKNREEFSTPEQVHLRMIVIKKGGESGRKQAEEIRQKVVAGADFEKLAQLYSEDSTQESGGDWGWIDHKTLNDSLTKVAFSLKPGEISQPMEQSGNCYLLYVEAKKHAITKPLPDVHDQIENKLLQTERQRAQEKWIESLRQKAYIKMF